VDERNRSKKIFADVGDKVPRRCGPCGAEAGFLESMTATTSVAKWICSKCGALNEFEVEFRIGPR